MAAVIAAKKEISGRSLDSNRTSIPSPGQSAPKFATFVAKRGTVEVIVVASALLAYVGTVAFGFVYDDGVQILQNPAIRNWGSVLQYFHKDVWAGLGTHSAATFYRPVFMLWLRLNDALFGQQPAGWHAAAAVLHAIASLLVCRLAACLTQSRATGCAVGILFALHPVHVESVAWVSGATDPLMTVFLCGAVLSYLEFDRSGKFRFLAWSVVLASMALLTKETAVLLPLLLGASLLSNGGGYRRLYAAKSLLIFVLLDGLYLALRHVALSGSQPFANMTIGQMVLTWPVVLAFYLRELVLPWRLSPFHDLLVAQSASEPRFLGSLVLLLAMVALLWWWVRRSSRRGLIVAGCAWLLVPLLPVLNLRVFKPGQLVQDRYLYLPSVGFSLLVVAAALDLLERFASGRVWKLGSALVVVTSLVYIVVVSVNQVAWAGDLLLYQHSVDVAPNNAAAAMNLGITYVQKGDLDQGTIWLERSAQLDGENSDIQFNLANAYYREGKLPVAYRCIRRSLELDPQRAQGWLLASEIALDSGDTEAALTAARHAQQLWPDGPGYHAMIGFVQLRRGDMSAAEEAFRQEILLHPDDQQAQQALANLKIGK